MGLQDLPATVLQLVGVPNRLGLPGRSLARFGDPSSSDGVPEPVFSQLITYDDRVIETVIVGYTKYIRYESRQGRLEKEQIFRLDRDPDEMIDHVGTAPGDSLLPELRSIFNTLTGTDASG